MCMADSGDGPEFWSQSSITARKVHVCGECGREIQPGEKYEKHFGVYEGSAFSGKTCLHCRVLCEWLEINCDGYIVGGVINDFTEHAHEYNRMDIARLAVMARNDWRSVRRKTMLPIPKLPRTIRPEDGRPW